MRDMIETRVADNIRRVANLVTIYRNHLQGRGQGRRAGHSLDVLRAAVVLLHATLEDFLRNLARWKLPSAPTASLVSIPLAGSRRRDKFDLGDLSNHRGISVDELLIRSIDGYLERTNYNNPEQICGLLSGIGLTVPAELERHLPALDCLMQRRHQIVHRADRDERGGRGNPRVRSISVAQVDEWIHTVDQFTKDTLDAMDG